MSNQPPYQNPQPGSGYTYYPDSGAQSPQGFPPPVSGYQQPPVAPVYAQPDPRKGQAITGFIMGLLSLILWIIPFVGGFLDLVLAIMGIVFSSLGLKSTTSRGLAIAGLVLSIISLVIAGIVVIGLIALFSAAAAHPSPSY